MMKMWKEIVVSLNNKNEKKTDSMAKTREIASADLSYWCHASLTTDRHRALTTQFYLLRFCIKCILYVCIWNEISTYRTHWDWLIPSMSHFRMSSVFFVISVRMYCFSSLFVSHAVLHVPNANTFTLITWHVVLMCALCFVVAAADWLRRFFWIYATAKTCLSISK